MSTKTTFKRIALVAVAALGFGMVSAIPSQAATGDFTVPTGNRGYDLVDAPKSITTRILLNAGKSQILAQAVQVLEK